VPTRTLSVDEPALFASESGCAPSLEIEVSAECSQKCGPIQVLRGTERVATLLAPRSAAPAPVPEPMRPSYTKPGQDANRTTLHLPLLPEGDAIRLESNCGAELASTRAGATRRGAELAISQELTNSCNAISAEVECR
jgi:hypothetical protein